MGSAAAIAAALLLWGAPVSGTPPDTPGEPDDAEESPEPGDPEPVGDDEPIVTPTAPEAGGGAVLPIPAGCPVPQWPQVVFIGVLVDSDDSTARFELQQVRAGSPEGYLVDDQLDVEYDIDTKYLSDGNQYLVGAGVDEETGDLFSKVSPEEPLFYTRSVVGVGDDEVECPSVEDSILTLTVTGRSLESGVFTPLSENRIDMVRSVVVPAVIAFGILVGLASIRWIGTGVFRGAWNLTVGRSRARRNL